MNGGGRPWPRDVTGSKGDARRTYEVADVAGASVFDSKAEVESKTEVQRKPNVNPVTLLQAGRRVTK